MTPGQSLAAEQLADLAAASGGAVEVVRGPLGSNGPDLAWDVSLDLRRTPTVPGGITLNPRERFLVFVPPAFPHKPPTVTVGHARWAGHPHVQWGRQLCLYAAPSVEWAPADGIRGLIDRLVLWCERAAAGTLDPDGQPPHPPVAYAFGHAGDVVVRADLGDRAPWACRPARRAAVLVAVCELRGDRLDVIGWADPDDHARHVRNNRVPLRAEDGAPLVAAACVLVDQGLGFEYPNEAQALADGLAAAGLPADGLLGLIGKTARINEALAQARGDAPSPRAPADDGGPGPGGAPLVVLVGTPSRRKPGGPPAAHLVAWRLDRLGGAVGPLIGKAKAGTALDDDIDGLARRWLALSRTVWLRVHEDRPEVTIRRDSASPAAWLRGKRVLVLGCGALGAPIAEACARAGAGRLVLADNGIVTPGVLVRQPYADADIGQNKAVVLARRLARQLPRLDVQGHADDAQTDGLREAAGDYDLIVDTTADAGVRSALEQARTADGAWPDLLTVVVGHQARRGVVAVSRRGATGGGHDALRRLGLAARTTRADELADIAADLYPDPPRAPDFSPEPGCSAPTFEGSAAEAGALAGLLLSAALDALNGTGPKGSDQPMACAAVRIADQPPRPGEPNRARGVTWAGWPNDAVVADDGSRRQVRISAAALAEIRAETRRAARTHGPRIETGGTLLGEVDDAAGVVFVDAATGPPPDSRLSAASFDHGTEGVQAAVDAQRARTARASGYAGMWHTHPRGRARPSDIDEQGMAGAVAPIGDGPPRSLMLILGGDGPAWDAWAGGGPGARPDLYARLVRRPDRHDGADDPTGAPAAPPAGPASGPSFPGGYALPPSVTNAAGARPGPVARALALLPRRR